MRKDGQEMVVEITSRRTEKSGKRWMKGIVTDVTRSRQLEGELKTSNEKYGVLFESMREGLAFHRIIYDEAGQPVDYVFLDINKAFTKLTGLQRDNLVGKRQSEVIPQEDPFWLRTYAEVVRTGEPVNIEHYSPELKKYFNVHAYRTGDGEFATIFSDVTDRVSSAAEIASTRDWLQSLNDYFTKLSTLPPETNLEKFINQQLKEFFGASLSVFSKYDPATNMLSVCDAIADKGLMANIIKAIGGRIENLKSLVPPEVHAHILTNPINRLKDVREATLNAVPATVSRAIEKVVGEHEFVVVAFLVNGKLYGTSIMVLGEKGKQVPENIGRNFLHISSVSMRRRNIEVQRDLDTRKSVKNMSLLLDLKDKETEGHSIRVAKLSVALGKKMGLSESELVQIEDGALLHDIGKIGIPDNVLLKPGALTAEEWVIMKRHPQYAYDILKTTISNSTIDIPYCHHEKWDGSGYPRGLKGDEIPIAARIFAVVDVWDAITSDRPYRQAMSKAEARQYIINQSGKHFDPNIVKTFLKLKL